MKKHYWIILIIYIAMQLSGLIGGVMLSLFAKFFGSSQANSELISVSYWLLISFSITTIIVLYLLKDEMKQALEYRHSYSTIMSLIWAVSGIFLALFSQAIAANIERKLGIQMGSENTKQIIHMIETVPLVIILSSVLGPILEEIVFRKIIFGSLYERFNFFISALISSIIFALAHFEPEHIILYSAMGFTFAFLYVKTKRIWVPIFAHVAMNTMVVLIQSVFKEDLEKFIQEGEKLQGFIFFHYVGEFFTRL